MVLFFLNVDPVGDFFGDQAGMEGQKDDLRVERITRSECSVKSLLGQIRSGNAIAIDELLAPQHAIRKEPGRLVVGYVQRLTPRPRLRLVKPQNRELHSFRHQKRMHAARAQGMIDSLHCGRATEEI